MVTRFSIIDTVLLCSSDSTLAAKVHCRGIRHNGCYNLSFLERSYAAKENRRYSPQAYGVVKTTRETG